MYVIYTQTEALSAICSIFQMNQFTQMLETEVKPACRAIFKLWASTQSFDLHNYSRWNGFK